MKQLNEKVAIVTGAGQGIGKGIALCLAKRGVKVVCTGRREAPIQQTVAEIEELGAHIVELENEINDPEVLRDHLLLRDKCDELDDSRFHQQELYDEWEKLAEEQDRMDAESDS